MKLTYEYVKQYINKYGYELKSTEYNNNREYLTITCSKGHTYTANFNHFHNGRRCPFCKSSKGEKLVYYILSTGLVEDISFVTQKRVRLPIADVRYDFFIDVEGGIFIEYNGEHHYRPIKGWGGVNGFKRRQELDNAKREYVKSIGATLIEIPYWLTIREIIDLLTSLLTKYIKLDYTVDDDELKEATKHSYSAYTIQEVAEYFKTHTAKETAEYFDISEYTVYRYYKFVYGKPKTIINRKSDKEIAEYYLNNTLEATIAFCGLDATLIARIFKSEYGMSKYNYYRHREREAIAGYFLTHREAEVVEKFGVSLSIVKKCMREVYGMSKREYLRKQNKKG